MANTLNNNKYLDLIGLAKFWDTVSSSITAGDSAVTTALTSSVTDLQNKIDENFKTVNSYTINGTAISTNPVLTGQHITLGANVDNNDSLGSSTTLFDAVVTLNESIISNNDAITGKFDKHTHALNSAVVVGISDTNFTGTLGTVLATGTNSTKVIKGYTGVTNATINPIDVASNDHTHKYKQPKISSTSFTGTLGTVLATGTNSTKVIKGYTGVTNATINSIAVASSNHTHEYKHPIISAASFTGTLGTVLATGSTETIKYAKSINDGTWPTFNSVNVASSNHTHDLTNVKVTGNITIDDINTTTKGVTVSTAATHKKTVLNSVSATFSTASGTTSVSKSDHTHDYNHSHTLSASFTGSAGNTGEKSFTIGSIVTYGTSDASLSINFGGFTHKHSYTPAGLVTGTALELGTGVMMGTSDSNVNVVTGITVGSISIGTVDVPSLEHYHDIDLKPKGSTTLEIGGTMGIPSSTASTLTSMNNNGVWPTLNTEEVTVALGGHQHSYTPAGNINVALTDEDKTTESPSGTINVVSSITGNVVSEVTTENVTVALGDHQHSYTPAGSITVTPIIEEVITETPQIITE